MSDRFARSVRFLLVLSALSTGMRAGAQTPRIQSDAPLAMAAAPFVVGIAELRLGPDSQKLAPFAAAFPKLLERRLGLIPYRLLSASENAFLDEKARLSKLYAAGAALAAARKKLDTATFTTADRDRQLADRVAAGTELAQKRNELDKLVRESVRGAGKRPVSTARYAKLEPWSGHKEGRFVQAASDIPKSMKDNKLDLLVAGSLAQVGSYGLLTIEIWSAVSTERLDSFEIFVYSDDPVEAAAAARERLETAVAGTPLALVRVKPTPEHATFRLSGPFAVVPVADGEFYCYGSGSYTVSAQAFGFAPLECSVRATVGQATSVEIALEPYDPPTFLVRTDPSDAKVYVSSVFAGMSPVDIMGDDERGLGEARFEGMRPTFFIFDVRRGDAIDVKLELEEERETSGFKRKQDRFFDSLGRFVVSLPVSVLSYGIFQLYTNSAQALINDIDAGRISLADAEPIKTRLETGYITSQTVFWISTAASAGFFVDSVISFVGYLSSTH